MGHQNGPGLAVDELFEGTHVHVASIGVEVGEYRHATGTDHHVHDVGDRVGREHHLLPGFDGERHASENLPAVGVARVRKLDAFKVHPRVVPAREH